MRFTIIWVMMLATSVPALAQTVVEPFENLVPPANQWTVTDGTVAGDSSGILFESTISNSGISFILPQMNSGGGIGFRYEIGNRDTSSLSYQIQLNDNADDDTQTCSFTIDAVEPVERAVFIPLTSNFTEPEISFVFTDSTVKALIETVTLIYDDGINTDAPLCYQDTTLLENDTVRYDHPALSYSYYEGIQNWNGDPNNPYLIMDDFGNLDFGFRGTLVSIQSPYLYPSADATVCIDGVCKLVSESTITFSGYERRSTFIDNSAEFSHYVSVTPTSGSEFAVASVTVAGEVQPEQQSETPPNIQYETMDIGGESITVAYDFTVDANSFLIAVGVSVVVFSFGWRTIQDMRNNAIIRKNNSV